jgi:hypothetical protein
VHRSALISFLLHRRSDQAREFGTARRENEADRRRGEVQFALEVAHNKRIRENALELDIALAEAGLPIVTYRYPETCSSRIAGCPIRCAIGDFILSHRSRTQKYCRCRHRVNSRR